jgi:hypothetical protein
MSFYAEARRPLATGDDANWRRLACGQAFKTQERAKAECAKALRYSITKGWEFRTVADDERGTVYQESKPPHGWRLRWVNAQW